MSHELLSEVQAKDHLIQFYMVRDSGSRAFSFQTIESALDFYEYRVRSEPGKWQLAAVLYDFGYRGAALPSTREEWERKNPAFQPRFLAWLRAIGATTRDHPAPNAYMAWVNARLAEFRDLRGMAREEPLGDRQEAFTDWLWETV